MNGLKGRCTGTIGRDYMAPVESFVEDKASGKKKVFRRFTMFVDGSQGEDGKRQTLKVILPDDAYGEKVFRALVSGRRVEVDGVVNYRPRAVQKENGDLVAYENAEMYLKTLHFMDTPLPGQRDYVLGVLMDTGIITNEQYEQYYNVITARIEGKEQ